MADYSRYYECDNKCGRATSYPGKCVNCYEKDYEKEEHQKELNKIRPLIKEVLREEGLI